MEPLWILIAFVLGFAVRQIGLPPLVGFLAAGFALHQLGVERTEALEEIADLGVYLLLFSIGLKLDLRDLVRKEIWAVASIHMLVTTVALGLVTFALASAGLAMFTGLDLKLSLLIGFALSFSSTVFAVKVFEEKGEMGSRHGRVAIGILIMQDLFAIVFLTASSGKFPSPWALLLLGLPLARPALIWLMQRCRHGELLVLLGLMLVFGAAYLFELVKLKPDLGALVAGLLVGSHAKGNELAKTLLGFKDLFLVGFFLNIGLSGSPDLTQLAVAAALLLLLPLKVLLFFVLMTRFRLRSRTALLGSLSLANYSEFGLIVGITAVNAGWLDDSWLVLIALALSMSFVVAAPVNTAAHRLFQSWADRLHRWESAERLPEDELITIHGVEIVVFGMGRVGVGVYDTLRETHEGKIIGVDRDPEAVRENEAGGRRMVVGDATDPDLYARVSTKGVSKLVVLALPSHEQVLIAAQLLRADGYTGALAATAQYPDEIEQLHAAGINSAFNVMAAAGVGFGRHVSALLDSPPGT